MNTPYKRIDISMVAAIHKRTTPIRLDYELLLF